MDIQKPTLSFCLDKSTRHEDFLLFFQDQLPEPYLSPTLFSIVSRYKGFIDNMESTKRWDYAKKISNDYELVNQGGNRSVSSINPISRSYFKLLEIIHDFGLVSRDKSTCRYAAIAEGPGGFVECFIRYRKSLFLGRDDHIYCITLRSDSSEIPNWNKAESLFHKHNVHVSYGKDGTGDLYCPENIMHYRDEVGGNTADLVTADGGFDYSIDFNKQEQLSLKLIYAEIVAALLTNAKGGSFVLKIFDIYTVLTAKLIYLLCHYYDRVTITKPVTSRPANSEKYVVAQGFRGIRDKDVTMLLDTLRDWNQQEEKGLYIDDIHGIFPSLVFIEQIRILNIEYARQQLRNILKTIVFIEKNLHVKDLNYLKQCQTLYALDWCRKYDNPINHACVYLR